MEYNVLDEARNALRNLEDNAWNNHRNEYPNAKGAVENFKDRIDAEELAIKEAKSQEEFDEAQAELTKIIDEIIKFNDYFNASLIPTNENKDVVNPDDTFKIDDNTINEFLNKMEE